ncbi:MAG: hypothetical protein KDA38_10455, partial [Planctomycetales bacterium]|nr:hypothetical protein [Planctomycetales bacterium]
FFFIILAVIWQFVVASATIVGVFVVIGGAFFRVGGACSLIGDVQSAIVGVLGVFGNVQW